MRVEYSIASNPVIRETPEQPDRQAFQSDSAVGPKAVTVPTPVITTRRASPLFVLFSLILYRSFRARADTPLRETFVTQKSLHPGRKAISLSLRIRRLAPSLWPS